MKFRSTGQLSLAPQPQRPSGSPCSIICTICGRGFNRRDSFAHHRRTHLEQMKCPVCHKLFTRSHDVKRHVLKVHARDINVKSEHYQNFFPSDLTLLENDSHHFSHFKDWLEQLKWYMQNKEQSRTCSTVYCEEGYNCIWSTRILSSGCGGMHFGRYYRHLKGACCFNYLPDERGSNFTLWYISTRLHGIGVHKTLISVVTNMGIWDLSK